MFRAQIIQANDQIFTISPAYGEILPEADDGTLFKVGFTPLTYGKNYQAQLIISVYIKFYLKYYTVKKILNFEFFFHKDTDVSVEVCLERGYA
jgi:hypothetical protein